MPIERTDWEDLPDSTKSAVEKYTGRVMHTETVSEGMNSAVAMVLETEFDKFFVKGLKVDYPRRWTQDIEWTIGPYVAGISPRVQWRVDDDEHWDLIGFEYIDGRHADFTRGSDDPDRVLDTMYTLGRIPCPNIDMKTAVGRWEPYIDDEEDLHYLDGDSLLHTDYNPMNVLITDGRALLIDWAWPTRGAGWIDPACFVLRLISNGWAADDAEALVDGIPAWRAAPRYGLDAFAGASSNMWTEVATADPVPWKTSMKEAAEHWLSYRFGA